MNTAPIVNTKHADDRCTAVKIKTLGWEKAIELQLVPANLADGIAVSELSSAIRSSQECLEQLKNAESQTRDQTKSRRRFVEEAEQQLRRERAEGQQAIREWEQEQRQAIRQAAQQKQRDLALATERKLLALRRERADIRCHADSVRPFRQQLRDAHRVLGNLEQRLDGLILASFPGAEYKQLRQAVQVADLRALEKWKTTKQTGGRS